jgi:hypothetical protein
MIRTNLARLTGSKRSLLAVLASSALFSAGCANMATTAVNSTAFDSAQAIGGKVHGGSQPISGAAVTLYFAGQGTAPIQAATTTTAADGTFTFTNSTTSSAPNNYICPTVLANPLVYAIVKGGNTIGDSNTSANNTAAAFIGIYGVCGSGTNPTPLVNTYITFNEVTTVATLLVAQQFFDPAAEGLSADSTGSAKIAIDNALTTINNLVNLSTGAAVSSTNINGSGSGNGVTVTATPESTKINLLANILASCVNNTNASAPNCLSLFATAVPPDPKTTNRPIGTTFAAPTDVLQALYYMLTNPTSGGSANLATLFGLASGAGAPFTPALATQPSDWTVAINYTSSSTCGASSGSFLSGPNAITVDEYGEIWIANSQATTGNLIELTGSGKAIACVPTGAGTSSANGAVFIDSSNVENVWSSLAGASTLSRYNPTTPAMPPIVFTSLAPVLAIAGDGSGNIFFSTATGLYEIAGGATAAAATTPTLVTSTVTNAVSLFPDTLGSVWASSGSSNLWQVVGSTVTPYTVGSSAQSVVVTSINDVFVSSINPGNTITYFTNDAKPATGYAIQNGWPLAAATGGLSQPASIVIDGARNVWSANNAANTGGLFSVSEVSNAGVPLSPDTAAGGFQKSASYLNASSSLIVDQTGNVWVVGSAASNNFVTEIIGAGVPICQPYAYCLAKSRFQSKP